MGTRSRREVFATEAEAKERAEGVKASAVPGYSEVYVTALFPSGGVWVVEWKEYYG